MFGKTRLTSREAMMSSTGCMSAMVSWRKMASCGDPPRNGPQEAGGYMGVQVGADAAQEDGPHDLDLRDRTDYGALVVRVRPVPFFVEAAENVCPVWW